MSNDFDSKHVPLLSICIPTYNRATIVYQHVVEYLSTNVDWIEIVVTDDCSTDHTETSLRSIKNSRFRYIKNSMSLGFCNLFQALKNGKGKYCLLLADNDSISSVDWNKIRKVLISKDIGVYSFDYTDAKGNFLNYPPRVRLPSNSISTYLKLFFCFRYSGGLAIKRELLDFFINSIDRNQTIWKLYCQQILALYCVKYADYDFLQYICIKRNERDCSNTKKSKAWLGGFTEPYWTLRARRNQRMEWIKFFSKFDNEKNNIRLARFVVQESLLATCSYHNILYNSYNEPIFLYYKVFLQQEREVYSGSWIRQTLFELKETINFFNQYICKYKFSFYFDLIIPFLRMVKYFIKVNIHFLKKNDS